MSTKKQITVRRDGGKDIAFVGCQVGSGEYTFDDNTRGQDVSIYVTKAGAIITKVLDWSRWEGERNRSRAAVHNSPKEAFEWLERRSRWEGERNPKTVVHKSRKPAFDWLEQQSKDGDEPFLSVAAKLAWDDACENSSVLEGHNVEFVE